MLSEETKERIKKEAQAYGKLALEVGENNFGLIFGTYERAATAEAQRAQVLVEALEEIKELTGGLVMPSFTLLNNIYKKVEQTLSQYNNNLK